MKTIALATLLTLIFITPSFSQTKKEKIEELLSITLGSKNSMLDKMDKMLDAIPFMKEPTKKTATTDTSMKGWAKDALHVPEQQQFEDTAAEHKRQRVKTAFKKVMADMVADMKKESAPMYDSVFTEAQIDRQLAFQKSEAGKRYREDFSGDFTKTLSIVNGTDTSYNSYVFAPGRKAKMDTLISYMMPKDMMKKFTTGLFSGSTMGSAMFSSIKDSTKRKEMIRSFDSTQKAMKKDPKYQKTEDKELETVTTRMEIFYDKTLSEKTIDDLIAHYKDPEEIKIQELQINLSLKLMQKVFPKMMGSLGKIMKDAK